MLLIGAKSLIGLYEVLCIDGTMAICGWVAKEKRVARRPARACDELGGNNAGRAGAIFPQ